MADKTLSLVYANDESSDDESSDDESSDDESSDDINVKDEHLKKRLLNPISLQSPRPERNLRLRTNLDGLEESDQKLSRRVLSRKPSIRRAVPSPPNNEKNSLKSISGSPGVPQVSPSGPRRAK